jgi:hypothetical protein
MPICEVGGRFDVNRFRYGIDLEGVRDGVNVVFTIPNNCVPHTIAVYLNGQRQDRDVDYITFDVGGGSFYHNRVQFLDPEYTAQAGDLLTADYVVN